MVFRGYASHAPRERVSWNSIICCDVVTPICHAPRERVSWNMLIACLLCAFIVTLHVSVWVEIALNYISSQNIQSRSTWACELKLPSWSLSWISPRHAPRERVSWNFCFGHSRQTISRHAPRERVSWNVLSAILIGEIQCHAPRERVSWNNPDTVNNKIGRSHAPRERVSWNFSASGKLTCIRCHAPRERVSWNAL